jgi:transforming growth factor-beta-induced protein
MKKLIALTAVAMLASSAHAGQKCKGTRTVVLSSTPCQQSHVTYITTAQPAAAHPAAKTDIVDTAIAAASFKTLGAAVQAAGLVDTLKGAGPFTVFAPTDEAFAKLPAGTVESLLKPENRAKLQAVLTYHVVAGKVMASDVVKVSFAKTVNGKAAVVKVNDAGVMIDNAKVVATDIETSNGVIHVIDSVILP